jgi:cytochrome c oxidase subunit 3
MASNKKHPFHLVDPSPWPFVTSMTLLVLCIGGVLYMHDIDKILLSYLDSPYIENQKI